jgi:hypothetical protein
MEACLSAKGSTGCCRRERAFERLRRNRTIAIKMVMRTKDPMTAPAMMPAFLFLPRIAPTAVGLPCSSLSLVGWGSELVTLSRAETLRNRTPQKVRYTSHRGTYEVTVPVPSVELVLGLIPED